MASSLRIVTLLALTVGLTGCFTIDGMVKAFQDLTGISTKVAMINPPNSPAAAQVRTVSVINDGSGANMRNKVEVLLAGVQVDGSSYFSVIENKNNQLINGLQGKNSTDREFDKHAIAEYGKSLGTEGVYVITNVQKHDSVKSFRENRRRCRNPKEKKCDEWVKYTVSCTERNVRFSFTPKLVNVANMTIIYGKDISVPKSDKLCEDGYGKLDSSQTLLNTASISALEVFRKDVSPYSTIEKVLLKTGDVESEKAELLLERGEEFAEKGRWGKACELWQQVSELEPASPAPWYNLAVCSERVGEYKKAVTLYKKAEDLSMKVDQRISDRLVATQVKLQRSQRIENIASAKDN